MPRLVLQGDRPLLPPTVTDRDGRFRISGIGRERYAQLWIEGPSIVTAAVWARTRPGPTIGDPDQPSDRHGRPKFILYGAEFSYKANPSRPVEGTVLDRETGRPLPGITIRSERPFVAAPATEYVSAVTDAEGRYRLTGLPVVGPIMLLATAPCDRPRRMFETTSDELPDESLPYMRSTTRLPGADPKSKDPIRLDFKLQRGVWVSGRVLDKRDGRPVQARVSYAAYRDNPTLLKVGVDSFQGYEYGQNATADGSFRLAVFPGPGLIAAATSQSDDYARGVGAESIPRLAEDQKKQTLGYPCVPASFHPAMFNVVAEISPRPTDQAVAIDLLFDTGRVLKLETVDSDGNLEVADALSGRDDRSYWEPVQGPPRSDFSVMKLVPGKKRIVTARNANKALIGQIELNGKEERPARLTLASWGEIHGRLVLAGEQPRPEDVQIFSGSGLERPAPWLIRIQKDGTFRIEGLVPGRSYSFFAMDRQGKSIGEILRDVSLKPGEVRDFGDLVMKPEKSQ
jgi:hypothetical protein